MKSWVILALSGGLLVGAGFIALWFISPSTVQPTAEPAVTSSTVYAPPSSSTITTSTTASTSTSTSQSTTTSSTTTLPMFYPLNWTGMDKCKETALGKMNTFYAVVPEGTLGDRWVTSPAESISYSCDGSPKYLIDRVVYRGGASVDRNNEMAGEYRLMAKCGHNARINDLMDCKQLDIFFNTSIPQNTTQA
jgi:hypothetical protein